MIYLVDISIFLSLASLNRTGNNGFFRFNEKLASFMGIPVVAFL